MKLDFSDTTAAAKVGEHSKSPVCALATIAVGSHDDLPVGVPGAEGVFLERISWLSRSAALKAPSRHLVSSSSLYLLNVAPESHDERLSGCDSFLSDVPEADWEVVAETYRHDRSTGRVR